MSRVGYSSDEGLEAGGGDGMERVAEGLDVRRWR